MNGKGEAAVQVAIDTNVYRNIDFFNYLKGIKKDVHLFIPSIAFLELGYFFLSKGLSWAGYRKEIEKIGADIIEWSNIDGQRVIERSIRQKATLSFGEHLIGVQCEALHINLITYNKRHFEWCQAIRVMTPEEFVITRIK